MDLATYRASLLSSISSEDEAGMSETQLLWAASEKLYAHAYKLVDAEMLTCQHCAAFVSTMVDLTRKLIEKREDRNHTDRLEKLVRQYENARVVRRRNYQMMDKTPRETDDFKRLERRAAQLAELVAKTEEDIKTLDKYANYVPPQVVSGGTRE